MNIKKSITIKKKNQEILIFDKKYPKKVDLKYVLKEPGASLDLFIKVLGKSKRKMEISVEVIHMTERTSSKIRTRCALFDEFHNSCQVNVKIEKRARGADARLDMKTLLLSNKARAVSKPVMQIQNNNVNASHAASIGRINKNQLFYIQSRGLNKKDAQEIFLADFFEDRITKNTKKYEQNRFSNF